MPTLIASGIGGVTGVTLENNSFWRLQIGQSYIGDSPALALVLRYPPQGDIIALVRVAVPLNASADEVGNVAKVALDTGDRDGDKARITEAFNLFKNNSRVQRQELFDQATAEGCALVDLYWDLNEWLLSGAENEFRKEVFGSVLIGRP